MNKDKDFEKQAILTLQEITDQAIDIGASKVEIEFSKEGGLEVIFISGNVGIGEIHVDESLESAVMELIFDRSGMENAACGVLLCESHGYNHKIQVEEYTSFGETAFRLTLPK
jgi:hypothetical protein